MSFDIKKIKVSPDFKVLEILEDYEHNKLVKNAVRNDEKYERYCHAVAKLQDFLKDGRGEARADDPSLENSYHAIMVDIFNDEFENEEIIEFTDILRMFDGMMLVGHSSGDTSFCLLMNDIYKE